MQVTVFSHCPDDWDRLAYECPWGTFYHGTGNLELLEALSSVELSYLSCRDDERLVAGIAYAVQQGPLGADGYTVKENPILAYWRRKDSESDNGAGDGRKVGILRRLFNKIGMDR